MAASAEQIFDELQSSFLETNSRRRRRFLPGLLISMMDLIRRVEANSGRFADLESFYAAHPRQTTTSDGARANTLILRVGANGSTQSIRPYYERFVRWLRIENKRLDYPKAAPHATQAWGDYTHWLEGLLALSDVEMSALEQRTRDFVLAQLQPHVRDPATLRREPLRFSLFLQDFDMRSRARSGETSGAAFQGTVFAFLRADAAHLQIETAKVRSGGKRENRVGDIDAVNGESLVIAAEVKQYVVSMQEVPDFEEFATQVDAEGALGMVLALDFADGACEALRAMGLEPLSKSDLQNSVRLWDSLKQRVAVEALLYYVTRIEQNTPLKLRVTEFFREVERAHAASLSVDPELPRTIPGSAGPDPLDG